MATTKIQDLTNVGNIADGDVLVGERVTGTTVTMTFNGIVFDSDFTTNGLMVRTAAGAYTNRTITGTANRLSVTDGDGVSGNPTLDIDAAYVGQGSIVTVGTITTGTWSADIIGTNTGTYDFGDATNLEIPNGSAPTVDAAGEIAVDTDVTDYTGMITYHDGTEALYAVGLPTGNLVTNDGYVIAYNATNNEFEMVPNAGGGIGAVVDDPTPQLGGDLDVNGNEIISIGGTDIDIHSDNDVNITLGDAAGADDLNVKDSAGSTIFSIDSNGNALANRYSIEGTAPSMRIYENDAPVDEGRWIFLFNNEEFNISTATDAAPGTRVDDAFTIARSGTSVDSVAIGGTSGDLLANGLSFDGGTNVLDEYEEGSWSPTVTCATPGDLGVSYTAQTGRYTRIGRLVVVYFRLRYTPTFTTASGELRLTGLPFTPSVFYGGVIQQTDSDTSFAAMPIPTANTSAQVIFREVTSAAATTTMSISDLTSGNAHVLDGNIYFDV